jgi:hypothetical protein
MGTAIIWGDVFDMPDDKRDEVRSWMRGLGVDLDSVTPRLKIELAKEGFRLHLSQYVCDDNGRKILDHAEERAVTRPVRTGHRSDQRGTTERARRSCRGRVFTLTGVSASAGLLSFERGARSTGTGAPGIWWRPTGQGT